MAKRYQLVDAQLPGPSKKTQVEDTDWSKCVLCQMITQESLQCPGESVRQGSGDGYVTLAANLIGFNKLQEMPLGVDVTRLDDGDGIESTFRRHMAKWHKSCNLKFNTTTLKRAAKRKSAENSAESDECGKKSRSARLSVQTIKCDQDICFFCDEKSDSEPLHLASTFGIDSHVRKCALEVQDERLLTKLTGGDMVAQDVKYHTRCLVSLYNKARHCRKDKAKQEPADQVLHGIVLAELIAYIEVTQDGEVSPVFRLADLLELYSSRLTQLGLEKQGRIHSTRLKDRIIAHLPGIRAHSEGRDVLLAFDTDVGLALRKACEKDSDDEAMCLAAAANFVRRDMFKQQAVFTGSFDRECKVKSVPQSLLSLVSMILNGPSIKSEAVVGTGVSQATLSIAQLLQYNSCIRRRPGSKSTYRQTSRETPLAIYTGMTIHAKTRNRKLVDKMSELGLSISYDRLMDISTDMGNRVCEQYCRENMVCPPNLREGLFTTAAVDNIDHNPSSTTAAGAFHGTGISLFQHPETEDAGVDRREHRILEGQTTLKTKFELPESYTSVLSVVLKKSDIPIPDTDGPVKGETPELMVAALDEENRWLEHVEQSYTEIVNEDQSIDEDSNISWAAYHACRSEKVVAPAITALLPLFPDDSKSPGMIRHSLDVIKVAVEQLNPGQVPVVTLDQPLYALAKNIQWSWPERYGEHQFVIILGGLHIELASLKVIGNWLEDSGWVEALVQANVASPGTAESFLKASHITRTRYAHQVTASSLYILLKRSYANYKDNVEPPDEPQDLDDWCTGRIEDIPQFQFWYIALQLQLLVLTYIRSLREKNFALYIESLTKLSPWFFTTNHIHYARWVSIHIRDMVRLRQALPEVAAEFTKGNFTIQKTKRSFSSMAIDQAHEQNNAAIKGDGGAVGLLQSPEALRRWMVAGPEIARLISEFEATMDGESVTDTRHHEQNAATQRKFMRDVNCLVDVIDEMGNPFQEDRKDLRQLDTGDIVDRTVVTLMRQAEETGQHQYEEFQKDRLIERTKSLTDPIKKNKLSLFSQPSTKAKSKSQVSSLKGDCSLFARMYITCQTREGNLDEFFTHENQACPPSLSNLGKLRHGTKSDLMDCLERDVESSDKPPDTDVIILDGAAIVNMLRPTDAKTFDDYAQKNFLPFVEKHLKRTRRVDIVWDQYIENSLKSQTRSERGKGMRRRVNGQNKLPGNWQQFLRIDENKTELFSFLAECATKLKDEGKLVVSTYGKDVLCNQLKDTEQLAPCNHEEADTRIFVHMADAVKEGLRTILIRTVDTDVVVLAIAAVVQTEVTELWIAFGTGAKFRHIPVHRIAAALGPDKSLALPMFHSYTGCDTVSSFGTIGKKTAWETWNMCADVTPTFQALSRSPPTITDDHFAVLERFTVLLYDRTSSLSSINEARKRLFTKKGRTMYTIPPTKGALLQHAKRAVYQGGHIWGSFIAVAPVIPCPSDWGWTDPLNWKPLWTTLPEASIASRQLLRCGCKKSCKGNCKCKKAALQCTALCQCSGQDCL